MLKKARKVTTIGWGQAPIAVVTVTDQLTGGLSRGAVAAMSGLEMSAIIPASAVNSDAADRTF